MYTQKIANIFDHIQDHSRLGIENKFLVNKSGRIFLRWTGLLYKFLPTNLEVCKPTFYNFYTSHLRWNSTISDHTDLGQNAVFHNFWRQITLSQYSGRSIVGFKRNCSKIFQNHPLLTINNRTIIRWNFYRDSNFHSRRQVFECL